MFYKIKLSKDLYQGYVKRFLDITLAIILLPLAMVFSLGIAIAIYNDTGLPVLYKGVRCGYLGKPFHIYKFRTMVKDADRLGGGTSALNDSRITKTGMFLRKTKLDEVPQLLNIIKGDMSFIGPRPELMKYTNSYNGEEKVILRVRPGITDYSSLKYINLDEIVGEDNVEEEYEKKVLPYKNELRIKYARTVSFYTDMNLFFLTVHGVIKKTIGYIRKNS